MSWLGDAHGTIKNFERKLIEKGKNVRAEFCEKSKIELEIPEDFETSYVYVIYVDGKIHEVYEDDRDGILGVIDELIELI